MDAFILRKNCITWYVLPCKAWKMKIVFLYGTEALDKFGAESDIYMAKK